MWLLHFKMSNYLQLVLQKGILVLNIHLTVSKLAKIWLLFIDIFHNNLKQTYPVSTYNLCEFKRFSALQPLWLAVIWARLWAEWIIRDWSSNQKRQKILNCFRVNIHRLFWEAASFAKTRSLTKQEFLKSVLLQTLSYQTLSSAGSTEFAGEL